MSTLSDKEIAKRVAALKAAIANPPSGTSSKTPTTFVEKFRAHFGLTGMQCWENTSKGGSLQLGKAVEITDEMLTAIVEAGLSQDEKQPRKFNRVVKAA